MKPKDAPEKGKGKGREEEYIRCSYCGGAGSVTVCDTVTMNCHRELCPRCGGKGKIEK